MALWDDTLVRARAGLFLDIPQIAPPELVPGIDNQSDPIRRQILRSISRLEARHAGNQALLESFVPMRKWLLGRYYDYQEWVQPCLDYLFLSLAERHGATVLEPLVSLGLFDFSVFQNRFKEEETDNTTEESPEALNLLNLLFDMMPAGPAEDKEFELIDFLLNTDIPDTDFVYIDGQGFSETSRRRHAREMALRLVDHCPDVEERHRRLGFTLLKLGEFANALVCFQRQQHHAPDDGVIYDNIAWCQMKLGWLDKAMANGKKAIDRIPEKSDVYHDYAGILLLRGKLEESLEVTSRALAECDDPVIQLYYLHALVLDRMGLADKAIAAWCTYLKRARVQPGHQKASARALAVLAARGCPYSVIRYPIRTIAEQMIQEINDRIEEVRNFLSSYEVSFNRLGDLERDLASSDLNTMDMLENHCRELFCRCETFMTTAVHIPEEGRAQLREIFCSMNLDQEKDTVSNYVLLKNGAKPLLMQINEQRPQWLDNYDVFGRQATQNVRNLFIPYVTFFNNLRALIETVDRAVTLGGWLYCRDFLNQQDSRLLQLETLEELLASWEENPPGNTPGIAICITDILKKLREKLPEDVLGAIGAGEGAFGLEKIRPVRHIYEKGAAAAEEAITGLPQRLRKTEQAIQSEKERLREEQRNADTQLAVLDSKKQKIETALLTAQHIETELAFCARLSKATGFWAALTGRKKRIRQINLEISQLSQQISDVLPNILPPRSHFTDPKADLNRLKHQIPDWIKVSRARLSSLDEESNRQTKHWREVKSQAGRTIEEQQQALKQKQQQISAEQKQQTEYRNRARRIVDVLKHFEDEAPNHGFFAGKDIVALGVLNNPETTFCCAGLADDRVVFRSLDPAQRDEFPGHTGGVAGIAVTPSGLWMASAGLDGQARLWSTKPPAIYRCATVGSPAYSVTFGEEWLFVGTDERIEVYSLPEVNSVHAIMEVEGMVWGLAFDWMRRRLFAITASFEEPLDSAVYIWDMRTSGPTLILRRRLFGFGGLGLSIACDPKGKWLAAGEGCGNPQAPEPSRVLLWDATTFRLKRVFTCHSGWVESVAFSPDGQWLVSGDAAGPIGNPRPSKLFLHDMKANRTALALEAHEGWVRSLAFTRKGGLLFSGGSDGVWAWDFPMLAARSHKT